MLFHKDSERGKLMNFWMWLSCFCHDSSLQSFFNSQMTVEKRKFVLAMVSCQSCDFERILRAFPPMSDDIGFGHG